MADLYGGAPSPATEPEEISFSLHHLFHQLDSSSSASAPPSHHHPPPPSFSVVELPDHHRFGLPECGNSGFNFSDPGSCSKAVSKRSGVSIGNDFGDFSSASERGTEVAPEVVRHKISSKRSRTAEIHNLSEKRRRSRINEKMRALQNLIPNSNKTDKASMLDEVIEYLKQLQLQVQMLTMRNGLSLHPMSLPGVMPPIQAPLSGLNFNEANGLLNTHPVTGTFPANMDNPVQPAVTVNLPNQCRVSNQPILLPSVTSIPSSETTIGFELIGQLNHWPLNFSTSSKEICREGTSQSQLTMNQQMKTSSSSVS